MSLFDPGPAVDPERLSSTRRLTLRNRELLDAGRHPATLTPLWIGTGERCGDCTHHHAYERNRIWHKCGRHRLGESHSAASDIRVSWPACALFDPSAGGTR